MSRTFPQLELEAGRLEDLEFTLLDRRGNPLPIALTDELYFDISQSKGGPAQVQLSNIAAIPGGSVIEIITRGNDATNPKLPCAGRIRLFGPDTNDLEGEYFGAFDLMDDSEIGNPIKPISRGVIRFNDNVTRP